MRYAHDGRKYAAVKTVVNKTDMTEEGHKYDQRWYDDMISQGIYESIQVSHLPQLFIWLMYNIKKRTNSGTDKNTHKTLTPTKIGTVTVAGQALAHNTDN